MYYILKYGETLNVIADLCTSSFSAAQSAADTLHEQTGDHYRIVKVESIWTTKTLADLLAEDPRHRAMIRGGAAT